MRRWGTRGALWGVVLTVCVGGHARGLGAGASQGEAGAAGHCCGASGVGHQLFLAAEPQWHAR